MLAAAVGVVAHAAHHHDGARPEYGSAAHHGEYGGGYGRVRYGKYWLYDVETEWSMADLRESTRMKRLPRNVTRETCNS